MQRAGGQLLGKASRTCVSVRIAPPQMEARERACGGGRRGRVAADVMANAQKPDRILREVAAADVTCEQHRGR